MVESIRSDIRDSQRPQEGAEVLQYRKTFEAGRRSESKGDIRIAGDTYGWLIGRGSRYGEYGLAILLLRREPNNRDAVKHLISCAKRSSHTSDLFPDSAMDSAFSVAAMAKLSDIAVSEHDRSDIAAWLRSTMSDTITPQVREWAKEKKADADSASIYGDIISAVESSRQSREYVKAFKWPEISRIFMNGDAAHEDAKERRPKTPYSPYSVVKFNKVSGATCQYDFEVKLTGNGTFDTADKVKSDIRRQLVKEFLAANGYNGVDDVRTSITSWSQSESSIKGSVIAFKMSVVRIEYDEATGGGKIVVRLDGRDMKAAQKWARENIAALVAEKNVALVVGRPPPPGAHYKTGSMRMTEDGLMEVMFGTRGDVE